MLWEESDGNAEKFKENIEVWFNNSMERVSGWYKRRTHIISLLCAVVVTVTANADTVVIAKALWSNPALRQSVVVSAQGYVAEQPRPSEAGEAVAASDAPPPLPPDQQVEEDYQQASARLKAAMEDLNELQLPIGWEEPSDTGAAPGKEEAFRLTKDDPKDDWPGAIWPLWDWSDWQRWLEALDEHTFGWLLTIIAVSLGAPFWFDTLNKIVSIRSAGKAPEEKQKSPREVPKPKAPGADA